MSKDGVAPSGNATAIDDASPAKLINSFGEDSEMEETPIKLQKIIRNGLVESKNVLEILKNDPRSPLYAVKSFESLNLKPELLRGVYNYGFNTPSKIQETALPTLLADPPQNMIAQSQSGTGKTAAFVLAMLSRVDVSLSHPQVLVLSPTYELACQTGEVASKISMFAPQITQRYVVKGEYLPRGSKITEHILFGTPGKVLDWSRGFFDLKKIKVFVLDEADLMISLQGHQDQSIRIKKQLSRDCQMMLFSATYDITVMKFAENIIENPIIIRLRREEECIDNIGQYWVDCPTPEDKFAAISNIYGVVTIGQAVIFCQTRRTAAWLVEKMQDEGHAVGLLSGELSVEDRMQVLDNFRDGQHEKVLIATNLAARGIDVPQVTFVVNYDLPIDPENYERADCETYLHRIGRSGRFGKQGLAINLVDSERSLKHLRQIETHFRRPIHKLDTEDPEQIEKIQRD